MCEGQIKCNIFPTLYDKLTAAKFGVLIEVVSTKLAVDLYERANMQEITTGWLDWGKDLDFSPVLLRF